MLSKWVVTYLIIPTCDIKVDWGGGWNRSQKIMAKGKQDPKLKTKFQEFQKAQSSIGH